MYTNAQQLYESILFRAAGEWGVDFEDVERDIAQRFDPIVRFMAGAIASELETVYRRIDDTELRIQDRLAKVLLPEYFHLPSPAHALATASPDSEPLLVDETLLFESQQEDTAEVHAFSPLFPAKLVPFQIQVFATESQIIDFSSRQKPKKGASATLDDEFSRLLIGFTMAEPLTNWQGVSLYFDIRGGGQGSEPEKARLFASLDGSQCLLDGKPLQSFRGLPSNDLILEDYLNGNERLQQQVRARYQRQFITFSAADVQPAEPEMASEMLSNWFSKSQSTKEEIQREVEKANTEELKQPLHWLEIRLGKPVTLQQVSTRLSVMFNVFPVSNRRLCGGDKGQHHFLPNTIKWIHIQPKEDFVAIRRVYEEKPPENQVFTYKPFTEFKDDRKPSYTIRHGGIGRWDGFNAWQRLSHVVTILQENYKHNEIIQKAAGALSLEDVHHLLGKKIAETLGTTQPGKDIYILLHTGSAAGMRVRVEYWTSTGVAANGIHAKTSLNCISKHAPRISSNSALLITPTEGGRDPLNPAEQLDAIKSTLLSRGRIVTREDVKLFCMDFLGEKLSAVHVSDGVGIDERYNFGMTRVLEVRLQPASTAAKDDWEGIAQQLEVLINQKSSSSIPIRVFLQG